MKKSEILKIIKIVFACTLLSACGQAPGSSSKIVIRVPKPAQSQGKVGALGATDFELSCFSVHVSASDLPAKRLVACAPEVAITSDWAAPGGSIVLEVPRGRARKLDVFAYQRTSVSDACPSAKVGANGLDATRVVRVGETASFDTLDAEVTVSVNVSMPPAGTNLVTQYQLPGSCSASNRTDMAGSARIVLGSALQTGGALRANASVSAQTNELTLTGGALKLQLSRKNQD